MIVEVGIGSITFGLLLQHIRIEHRLTRLETKIEIICSQLQEMKKCDSEK